MKVCIIGPYPKKENQPMTGPMRVVYSLFKEFKKNNNVRVEVPTKDYKRKFFVIFKIIKRIFFSDSDVFNIHGTGIGLLPLLIGKIKRKKVILTVHGLLSIEKKLGYSYSFWKILSEKISLKLADSIVVVSRDIKRLLKKYYRLDTSSIEIISNGVSKTFLKRSSKDIFLDKYSVTKKDSLILFVGNTKKSKGLDFLIKSFNKIKENGKYLLVLIGSKKEYKKYFGKENPKNIVLVGKLNQKLLKSAYNASDLVVVPSFYETFGLVALEAMACGKPIIISNRVGMRHLINDDDMIVKYGDVKGLSNTIRECLEDKKSMKYKGLKNKEVALNYTWDLISKKYLKLYRGLVGYEE